MSFTDDAVAWLERAAEKCRARKGCNATALMEQTAPDGHPERIIVWGIAVGALSDAVASKCDIAPATPTIAVLDDWSGSRSRDKGEVSELFGSCAARLRRSVA